MKIYRVMQATGLLWLAVAGDASAHGKDGVHLKGVFKAMTAQTLSMVTTDNAEVTVRIDAKTQFSRGEEGVPASDLIAEEKIVVHAKKSKDGGLLAEHVKLGKRASGPQAPAKADSKKGMAGDRAPF